MSRIFIAYASEDAHHALRLHEELHKLNYPAWLDLDDLALPRADGAPELAQLISDVTRACTKLIIVHSEHTKTAVGVKKEFSDFCSHPGSRAVIVCKMDRAKASWPPRHRIKLTEIDFRSKSFDIG